MLAAKAATTTIPIVFTAGADPVGLGLVASLNEPGGDITGSINSLRGWRRSGWAYCMRWFPRPRPLRCSLTQIFRCRYALRDVQEAAASLGVQLIIARANAESDFDAAFSTFVQQRSGALLVCASPFFKQARATCRAGARHSMPAIYEWREFAEAGGLMSYGTRLSDAYRQAGVYAGRVLKGEKPADLPIIQIDQVEFVINLKTAKALGLTVPPTLAARADEVIE